MVLSAQAEVTQFQEHVLTNFNKTFKYEPPIIAVQELENIFSIERKNLRAWLNVLCLGQETNVERRKARRCN
jgi:hypothetical protein